ncbi:MAG: cupredoxin domain-containing protein [Chloroflexota bacterium]
MAEVTVAHGYRPAIILARADMPIRLLFRRDDDDVCTERVIFSAPRLERRLTRHGVTTVDLPAHPMGEIRFTCGMGRYRGVIKLEPPPTSPIASHLRRVRRVAPALALVGLAWLLGIPALALLAAAGRIGTGAIVALVVVLAVVSAGSSWAVCRLRSSAAMTLPDEQPDSGVEVARSERPERGER